MSTLYLILWIPFHLQQDKNLPNSESAPDIKHQGSLVEASFNSMNSINSDLKIILKNVKYYFVDTSQLITSMPVS